MNGKNLGIWFVVGGLLVLFLMAGTTSRSAVTYDTHENEFTVAIKNYKTPIVTGDTRFTVTANFANPTGTDGSMWAQCSLLDYNLHKTWIDAYPGGRQASSEVFTNQRNNCVANEPFTQTARVTLNARENLDVTFTLTVPNDLDTKTAVLWCGTFERCYNPAEPSQSIMASDSKYLMVSAQRPSTSQANVETTTGGVITTAGVKDYACKLDRDCPGYFLDQTTCDNGYCIDVPPQNVTWDNKHVKQWASSHSIILWIVGIGLVLIGIYFIYEKPGQIGF